MRAGLLYLIFNRMHGDNDEEPKRRLGFGDDENYEDFNDTSYKRRRKQYASDSEGDDYERSEHTHNRRYGNDEQSRRNPRFRDGNRR